MGEERGGARGGSGEWSRFVGRGFVWKVDLKGIEVGGITGVRKGRGYQGWKKAKYQWEGSKIIFIS